MATSNFWTFNDYSREKSTFSVWSQDLTAANFDAQATARQALETAMLQLVLGTLNKEGYSSQAIGVNTPPASPAAQRENKWLIRYEGFQSGKIFTVELPVADLITAGHLLPNSDEADLTDADWTAFISAFNAFVRSPDDPTEAVVFLDAHFVGRNL